MSIYITRVKAIGVHGRFDFDQELRSGMNILHGLNGSGKTTFLQIVANALNSDFQRFQYIKFKYIKIIYSDDRFLEISWNRKKNVIEISRSDRRVKHELNRDENNHKVFNGLEPLVSAFYVPAFRLLVDAWFSSKDYQHLNIQEIVDKKTSYSRKVFGEFTPEIEYPSVTEVIDSLDTDLKNARLKLANFEREIFLNSLVEFYTTISKNAVTTDLKSVNYNDVSEVITKLDSHKLQDKNISFSEFIERTRDLIPKFNGTKSVLDIHYKCFTALLKYQEECYKDLDSYLDAVNLFLVNNELVFEKENENSSNPSFCFKYKTQEFSETLPVQGLSSGERQIVSLIYAFYIAREKIILIDEPEISLHIDWQRDFPKSVSNYSRQMIICTHSPMLTSDCRDSLTKLKVKLTTEEILWDDESEELDENTQEMDDYDATEYQEEYQEDIASAIQL